MRAVEWASEAPSPSLNTHNLPPTRLPQTERTVVLVAVGEDVVALAAHLRVDPLPLKHAAVGVDVAAEAAGWGTRVGGYGGWLMEAQCCSQGHVAAHRSALAPPQGHVVARRAPRASPRTRPDSPVHAALIPVALVLLHDAAVLAAVRDGALAVALVVLPLALGWGCGRPWRRSTALSQ